MAHTGGIDILYLTIPVEHADQAISLAEYLNQHGVCASPDGSDAVLCPIESAERAVVIDNLRATWALYWSHSDSGLFGLPMLIKTSGEGCPQCGVGPRVE